MKVSEIVGRNVETLTKEEREYILSVEIKEAYNYSKGDDFFTFCIFEDGSVTKTDAATDDEVGSSLEEMEQLESDGYEIEDVTDEYNFQHLKGLFNSRNGGKKLWLRQV